MKFINLLKQADFNLILPKENIQPLALIIRKERNIFSWYKQNEGSLINSSLKDLFVISGRGSIYPKIMTQKLPKNLIGSDLVDGSGSFAANFVDKANYQAGASVKRSKNMLFSFTDSIELSINLIELDEYLFSAKLNEKSSTFSDAAMQGNIFVITSALISGVLKLTNANDFEYNGNINANIIDECITVSANASHNNNEIFCIDSQGDIPLTFAIKAIRILRVNNKFRIKPEAINVRATKNEFEYYIAKEEIVIE